MAPQYIPPEIIDHILSPSSSAHNPAWPGATLPLVCRSWRHRINTRRFARVYLEATSSIQAFAALVTTHVWDDTYDDVAQHVTWLRLRLTPRTWHTRKDDTAGGTRAFDDGSIVAILNSIFRRKEGIHLANTTLDLYATPWELPDEPGTLDFALLPSQLTSALRDLCCASRLRSLILKSFKNVPCSFLYSLSVVELRLECVYFHAASSTDDEALQSQGPILRNLEILSLPVQSSSTIMDALADTSRDTMPVLRTFVTELTNINSHQALFTHFGERLSKIILLSGPKLVLSTPSHIPANLEILELQFTLRISPSDHLQPAVQPIFLHAFNALPLRPPSSLLIKIAIDTQLYVNDQTLERAQHLIYERIYHTSLLRALRKNRTYRTNVILTLNMQYTFMDGAQDEVHVLDEKHRMGMRRRFDSLGEEEDFVLLVTVEGHRVSG